MKAILTKDQLFQLAANAINASAPAGLGFLHFNPKEYTPEEIKDGTDPERIKDYGLRFDYYDGRMVKLTILASKDEEDTYDVLPDKPRTDYQSWSIKYPTSQDLINSVKYAGLGDQA